MVLKQLSMFMENRPGQLLAPCDVLGKAGINMLLLVLADTQKFGILRIIVREWEKAKAVLEKAGCVVTVTDVVGVKIASRPGGLAAVLRGIEDAKVNVEYMYAFPTRRGVDGVMIFRFDEPDRAVRALKEKDFHLVDNAELERMVGEG